MKKKYISYETLNIDLKSKQENIKDELRDQFLEKRLDLCKECQSNRVVCILRPMCRERRFLDVLFGANYDHTKIPRFCYSQRLKEFNQAKKQKTEPINDAWIFSDDLGGALGRKATKLKKGTKNIDKFISVFENARYSKITDNLYLFTIEDQLFLIDFETNLAVLNLKRWNFDTIETIQSLFEILVDFKGLEINITEEPGHFISFLFSFNGLKLDKVITELLIRKSDFLFGTFDNNIVGEIAIHNSNVENFISISNSVKSIIKENQEKSQSEN